MKTMHLKISTVVFMLLYFISLNGFASKIDYKKSKTINKTYQVKTSHQLGIDNKFGEVKITTWDKNEVVVNITISVEANSEKETIRRLDNIDVKIAEGADETRFNTYFKDKKSNNSSGKSEMSIDYEVKMPKSNDLEVENSFGAFIINDLDGKAKIEVKFGSARIGKLNHPDSELSFEFSDPVEIEHLENTELTLKYSKLKLNSATQLNMKSEFSGSKINGVGKLDLTIKFGSIDLDQVISANVKSNMSSIDIGKLVESGNFEPKYGSLSISTVSSGFGNLIVDGEFSPIDIKIEQGASFNAEVNASMASVKVPSEGWNEKEKDMNTKSFKGSFGQAPDNLVKIKSSFGSIKLDF